MRISFKPSIDWLLAFVPISVLLEAAHVPPPVLFFPAALAIVPIARLIVVSTEQLAMRTGDAIGGLMNATFGSQWSLGRAVGGLVAASVLAAYMSEILVGAAEGTGQTLGMSDAFIGIVLLAVIGGAAESGSAITMARKNKLDLTIGIAMGSSIQIALFVAPVLVLASGFIAPQPLELSFSRAEIGTLFLGVLIGAIVAGDARSNWYKGAQLILVYAMIAILFYFLPEAVP
jgi:Ca2+:H+ antiporter